ncbi:MAG: hypothetical protein EBU08_19675 [Micrococcales bacterium]|nr:hypothetical protein [Micrococcales bacterium]
MIRNEIEILENIYWKFTQGYIWICTRPTDWEEPESHPISIQEQEEFFQALRKVIDAHSPRS